MQDKCVCLCERKKEKCVDRSGGMSGNRIASGLAAHMTRHRNATVGVESSICHSDLHVLTATKKYEDIRQLGIFSTCSFVIPQ